MLSDQQIKDFCGRQQSQTKVHPGERLGVSPPCRAVDRNQVSHSRIALPRGFLNELSQKRALQRPDKPLKKVSGVWNSPARQNHSTFEVPPKFQTRSRRL